MDAIGFVVAVVVFWIIIFLFLFWISRRALHSPTDAELEYEQEQAEHSAEHASEAGVAH